MASNIWVVDSSVVLRALLDGSVAATTWLEEVTASDGRLAGSEMLAIEVRRIALNRELATGDATIASDAELFLSRFDLMDIDRVITARASAIRLPLRAADAIHLATALDWGANAVSFATHDGQQAEAARALGFRVFDPVTDDPNRGPVA